MLFRSNASPVLTRQLEIGSSPRPLQLALGHITAQATVALAAGQTGNVTLGNTQGLHTLTVGPRNSAVTVRVLLASGGAAVPPASLSAAPAGPSPARWPQEVRTRVRPSTANDAYVVDHIGLPEQNPWNRKVRGSDIQFLPDGTGVLFTLDGDVWLARGLHDPAGEVR